MAQNKSESELFEESIDESLSFEDAMKALEALLETMESGELTLDQSLKAYQRGVLLTRHCQKTLRQAEQQVSILTKRSADAELEPFDEP